MHCLVPFFAPDLERAEELRSVWCSPCEVLCGTGVATSGPSLLKGERMGLLVLGRASWCGQKSEPAACSVGRKQEELGICVQLRGCGPVGITEVDCEPAGSSRDRIREGMGTGGIAAGVSCGLPNQEDEWVRPCTDSWK